MKKRKLSDIEKAYKKAYSQLKSAITRVENEGFEAYIQLPKLVKNPSQASIKRVLNLKALVLEQSFKVDDKGNKISRLKYKDTLKKAKDLHKELLQGEKVLTKDMQRDYLSGIRDVTSSDLYGEALVDLKGELETIAESFLILHSDKYDVNGWQKLTDIERRFWDWIKNATPDMIETAKKSINWNKFIVQFYDSEGPGRGLRPFLDTMEDEVSKLSKIVSKNSSEYNSMTYADKFAAGMV